MRVSSDTGNKVKIEETIKKWGTERGQVKPELKMERRKVRRRVKKRFIRTTDVIQTEQNQDSELRRDIKFYNAVTTDFVLC